MTEPLPATTKAATTKAATTGPATPANGEPRILFCGDRQVSARLLERIRADGAHIVALGLNNPPYGEAVEEVRAAAEVEPDRVFYGRAFASEVALSRYAATAPQLGICCGFASILPRRLLEIPQWGWVNFHRSYLPYNRGLDPLQWAVVDKTPAGVTLHVMTEAVDAGAIVTQAELGVHPMDNGASLSRRADELILRLFDDVWPDLRRGRIKSTPQEHDLATYHSWEDCVKLRQLDRRSEMNVGRLIDIVRSYTGEGASGATFVDGPIRFSVHARVVPDVPATVRQQPEPTYNQNPEVPE